MFLQSKLETHGRSWKMTLQPRKNTLTFQVTAGGGWQAFLRFTPHQFQAYLQHFHLLFFPFPLENVVAGSNRTCLKRFPSTCVQRQKDLTTGTKELTKETAPNMNSCWNTLFSFPTVLWVAVSPFSPLSFSEREKAESVNFLFWAVPCFFPPFLGFG